MMRVFQFSVVWLFVLMCCVSSCEQEEYAIYKEIEQAYISAHIDGQAVTATGITGNAYDNQYLFDAAAERGQGVDQLNLIRYTQDGRTSLKIFAHGWRLLDRSYPSFLSSELSDPTACQTLMIQYVEQLADGTERVRTGEIEMTIAQWDTAGWMTGTFAGFLTDEGQPIAIQKGRFRIRVLVQYV